MKKPESLTIVDVFPLTAGGGNPAPVVTDAAGLNAEDMRGIAFRLGFESAFVLPATDPKNDFHFRFFVPAGEVEMCGHATIGALWLLHSERRIGVGNVAIETASGVVLGRVTADGRVHVSQPTGRVEMLADERLRLKTALILGVTENRLLDCPIANARTSRPKTLIGLRSAEDVHRLKPDFREIKKFCEQIGSTGLYPFAAGDPAGPTFHARQFPKASGYPEDAATGIAATALAFGLRSLGLSDPAAAGIRVRQGEAMGRASEISVRFATEGEPPEVGCWLGGPVTPHVA